VPRIMVEFINTCPCCDEYVRIIRSAAAPYGDSVEVKVYYAGKDLDYLRKYGPINKGTMIVNGRKRFDVLSRDIIARAIEDAVRSDAN
jgi:hypothetical protein